MMNRQQIEAWAGEALERVRSGDRVEDSSVELKRELPQPEASARQIAGLLNASLGAPALWLIGVDEKSGAISAAPTAELSSWWNSVASKFEGLVPAMRDVALLTDQGRSVLALAFESEDAPYVVKNPAFGKPNGGPVELEIPWRDGTSTRTARRLDLVRLLVRRGSPPEIDVLAGGCHLQGVFGVAGGMTAKWMLELQIYVMPAQADALTIPYHRCDVTCSIRGLEETFHATQLAFAPTYELLGPPIQSPSVKIGHAEVSFVGPGQATFECFPDLPERDKWPSDELTATITLRPIRTAPSKIVATLHVARTGGAAVLVHSAAS